MHCDCLVAKGVNNCHGTEWRVWRWEMPRDNFYCMAAANSMHTRTRLSNSFLCLCRSSILLLFTACVVEKPIYEQHAPIHADTAYSYYDYAVLSRRCA